MLDEGNAPNLMETPDAPPPEQKGNRTFWIVGGIMAGLVFLTLVCMAVYFLVIAPRIAAQRSAAQATIEAGNAQALQQLTLTAQAASVFSHSSEFTFAISNRYDSSQYPDSQPNTCHCSEHPRFNRYQ